MKKTVFVTLLLVGLSSTVAFAHCGSCGVGGEEGAKHDKMHDKNKKMAENLGLSEEQTTKVDAIMAEKMEKKKALRKESKEKMDALKAEYDGKLKEVLTPEQYEKHKSMKKDKMKGSDKESKGSDGDMKGSHGSMKDK